MQPSALAKRVSFVLLLALIVFYFYGLGHLPLVGPDEPRYAQVAREMLMRGDLITPTLGGQVWFEKPVLLYWVMMFCYKIFGVTEQAARLGPATAGVLTILAIYWLGRKVEIASGDFELTDFGFWTALVTGTSLGMIVFSRGASFDILVTMTTTWALVLFFVEEIEATRGRRTFFLTGFYVFVGLSLLAKGLVGLLPLAVVGTYYLMRRKVPPRRLILSLAWGIPLAMTIAALWYGPVIARHGWLFIDQFIIQHHFARYLSNKYHHPQPFFFYLIVIVPLTLPWTPFLLYGLGRLRHVQWRRQDSVDMLRVFSFSWVLLPMLVFSFSGSKLPGYILPVVPAAALLGGERLTRFISTGVIGRGAMRAIALLTIIFAVGAPFYARRFEAIPFSCAIAIAITLMTAGLIALIMTRLAAVSAISIACSTVISLMILLNCGEAGLGQRESVKGLIQIADARGYSGLRVCSLHTIDQTAHFYASGRLIYGADSEPAKFEGAAEILETARINNGAVLVLVPLEYVGQLTELKSAKTELLADNGRIAIVAVRLL